MIKILFLDIDGVLNGHQKLDNSVYCGIDKNCMRLLNEILLTTDARIIISSAWRYQIINGATTLRGFEYMLYTHGLIPHPRGHQWLLDFTCADEVFVCRESQIMNSKNIHNPDKWVVLDDLELKFSPKSQHRFIKTDPAIGLTKDIAIKVIDMFIK